MNTFEMFQNTKEPSYSVLEDQETQSPERLLPNEDSQTTSRHRSPLLNKYFPWVASIVVLIALCLVSFKFGQEYQSTLPTQPTIFSLLKQTPLDTEALGLRPNTLYPKPLGKKVLILDVDTRPWNPEEEVYNQTSLAWGRLNHYLYAKIHNYDYKFVRAAEIPVGAHATWVKVLELKRLLLSTNPNNTHDFVVFTDSDVIFPHLNLPIENLMSHWNITSDISLAGAIDPRDKWNSDTKGNTNINTGFMILQKSERTDALMKDWLECPTNKKYKKCGHWKYELFHEQSALSEHLRYDEVYGPSLRQIECGEANGIPVDPTLPKEETKRAAAAGAKEIRQEGGGEHLNNFFKRQWCSGKFIRHYWIDKSMVKPAVKNGISHLFTPGVWGELVQDWIEREVFEDRSETDPINFDDVKLDNRW